MMRPLVGAAALMIVCNPALAADLADYSAPSGPSAYDSTNPQQDVVLFTDQDVNGVIARGGIDYRF
jgi:hypothetical protein